MRASSDEQVAAPGVVTRVSPAPRDEWNSALASNGGASAMLRPEWLDSITATGVWRDASRCVRLGSGRTVILPLVKRRAGPLLFLRGWPEGWLTAGAVAAGGCTDEERAAVVRDLFSTAAFSTAVAMRGEPPVELPRGVSATAKHVQVLSLEGGLETVVNQRFHKSARKNLNIARRAGLEVTTGMGPEQLAAFSTVYGAAVERWARQRGQLRVVTRVLAPQRRVERQLRSVTGRLGERVGLWIAWREGRPVAATVVLFGTSSATSWLAATDVDAAEGTFAGHLLYFLAIEESCRRGLTEFDMGESDSGSGVEAWKARFGAEFRPVVELRRDRLPLLGIRQTARRLVNRRGGGDK